MQRSYLCVSRFLHVLTLGLQASVTILFLVTAYQICQNCEYLNLRRYDLFPRRLTFGCHIAQQRVQTEAKTLSGRDPFVGRKSHLVPPNCLWKTAQ